GKIATHGYSWRSRTGSRQIGGEIKWHCKYARKNGIHVSPTFMIDGLVQSDMSRGDEVGIWVKKALGN
ncbi:thioredoxin, partial [Rhizobium ruizarguesonis]